MRTDPGHFWIALGRPVANTFLHGSGTAFIVTRKANLLG